MIRAILLSVFVPLCLGATTIAPAGDIVATLAKMGSSVSTLVELVKTAGLVDPLTQGGPYTVFVPVNSAFQHLGDKAIADLKSNPDKLASILKYHVVQGIYKLTDLHTNEMQLDTLAGSKARINYYFTARRHVTAEGSLVIRPNIIASNGVIHLVQDVMMPPAGNIVEVLSNDGNYTTLVAAAQAAGLVEALQEGPFTLMAPNNAAFAALGNDTVNKLLQNPDLLKKVLLYHVIPGTIYSNGMHTGSLHTLEEDDRERIRASFSSFFGSYIRVDGITKVVKADTSATNGVIHQIDHVLIPSSLRTQISSL